MKEIIMIRNVLDLLRQIENKLNEGEYISGRYRAFETALGPNHSLNEIGSFLGLHPHNSLMRMTGCNIKRNKKRCDGCLFNEVAIKIKRNDYYYTETEIFLCDYPNVIEDMLGLGKYKECPQNLDFIKRANFWFLKELKRLEEKFKREEKEKKMISTETFFLSIMLLLTLVTLIMKIAG